MVMRLLRLALKLYPLSWRDRYLAEFEALLAQEKPTFRVLWDVVRSGLVARLAISGWSQGLASLAALWAVVVGIIFWFLPTGTQCTSALVSASPGTAASSSTASTCTSTTVAGSVHGTVVLLIILTVAFGLLPYVFRKTRWVLAVWGGAILAFYVLTFGFDIFLVPAGIVALTASLLPRRHRTPAT